VSSWPVPAGGRPPQRGGAEEGRRAALDLQGGRVLPSGVHPAMSWTPRRSAYPRATAAGCSDHAAWCGLTRGGRARLRPVRNVRPVCYRAICLEYQQVSTDRGEWALGRPAVGALSGAVSACFAGCLVVALPEVSSAEERSRRAPLAGRLQLALSAAWSWSSHRWLSIMITLTGPWKRRPSADSLPCSRARA
jgi:hypothetical protein